MTQVTIEKALNLFKNQGGILRSREAFALGINPKTLYAMRDKGYIEAIDRGIYHLIDNTMEINYIDLITVSKRVPKAVICLLSALAFHGLTTQIPHYIYVAYQQGWRQPKLDYPPIKVFRYSQESFDAGIEFHKLNGIDVPIYSAAKTVMDCFKFRNKIGLDIAIEALRDYWHKNREATVGELLNYAKVCRVEKIVIPYIEAIIHE